MRRPSYLCIEPKPPNTTLFWHIETVAILHSPQRLVLLKLHQFLSQNSQQEDDYAQTTPSEAFLFQLLRPGLDPFICFVILIVLVQSQPTEVPIAQQCLSRQHTESWSGIGHFGKIAQRAINKHSGIEERLVTMIGVLKQRLSILEIP